MRNFQLPQTYIFLLAPVRTLRFCPLTNPRSVHDVYFVLDSFACVPLSPCFLFRSRRDFFCVLLTAGCNEQIIGVCRAVVLILAPLLFFPVRG